MPDPETDRPHIVVHMAGSIDGRVVTSRWGGFSIGSLYEDVHGTLGGDAWMCGRVTMQGYTRGTPADNRDPTPVARKDFIARRDASGYAVALDFHGRLHWGARNAIDDDHVVVVLGERVSDAHLNALRQAGVSYVFGGADALDLGRVVRTLTREFGILRLLVEGGGGINGAFLQAGLVDEVSLLLAPVIDGGRGVPALFDADDVSGAPPGHRARLSLEACEPLPNGIARLRYAVKFEPALLHNG